MLRALTPRSSAAMVSLSGRTARVSGRFRSFNVGEASEVGFE